MAALSITTLYTAILVAMVAGLGAWVGGSRLVRADVSKVEQRSRVHGNLVENAPLFLLSLLLCELQGGSPLVLHGLGAAFVVARLSHAIGLSRWRGRSRPRQLGIVSTWTLMGATATYALWLAWAP